LSIQSCLFKTHSATCIIASGHWTLARQILFDGSDVAGEPTELFYVVAPLLGKGAYSTPLARCHSPLMRGLGWGL